MRIRRMRFDIWLCGLIALGIAWLVGKGVEAVAPATYDSYVEEHQVEDGEVGGIAGEDVFRAESVDDMLSHDRFTVLSHGIEYRNEGGGYYHSSYFQNLLLPSGERVAALINEDSVQQLGDDYYSSDKILPVGKVVYEDLSQDQTFLKQIGYSHKLTRTDFYVDMRGGGGTVSQDTYVGNYVPLFQIIAFIIVFPLAHAAGSKLGIFPQFFSFKKKENKSEWD